MKKYFKSNYLPAMLGALIEYYDIALYGYMAPVLVQVFLPQFSKLTAYFYYFFFCVFASFCRYLGARFFGNIGDNQGRKKALYYAMLCTSAVTFLISMLPTYEQIGIFATMLFALCRALQRFFLGGEFNGGAIYCLEHEKNNKKHGLVSGLYCALTVSGILLASFVATIINYFGPNYFRIAYAFSFVLAILTYSIRGKLEETPEYLQSKLEKNKQIIQQDKTYHKNKKHKFLEIFLLKNQFISLIVATLFFGVVYGLPTKIFNVILPIATGINTTYIMLTNNLYLIIYMLLLVVFGALADKYGVKKVMRSSALLSAFLIYPIFMLLETKTIYAIIVAKIIFAILASAFVGPFHAWAQQLFETKSRYKNISSAYAVGKCISTLLLAFSILFFKSYQSLFGIAIILTIIAIIAWKVFKEQHSCDTKISYCKNEEFENALTNSN